MRGVTHAQLHGHPRPARRLRGGRAIAAPFIVLAFLFYLCALWRCWASTRTHAAYQATLRTQLRSDAALSARDDAMTARGAVPDGCELCAADADLPERDAEALAELRVRTVRALEARATRVARSRRTGA